MSVHSFFSLLKDSWEKAAVWPMNEWTKEGSSSLSHRPDPETCEPLETYLGYRILVISISYLFSALHREGEKGKACVGDHLWNSVLSFHYVCAIAQTQVGRVSGKHLHPACHLASALLFSFPTAHVTQSSYRWKGDELRRQSRSEGKAVQKTPVMLRNKIASARLSLSLLEESSKTPTLQHRSHWAHLSPFILSSLFSSSSVPVL